MTPHRQPRQYRYYDFVMAAYVCVLLCSNLIGPAKETSIQVPVFGTVTFLAGVLFFPISYIFGDILTEVYGYGRDRRVVWAGFAALAFASIMAAVVVHLPPSASIARRPSRRSRRYSAIRRASWWRRSRAFLCGTFVNSYVLAKMKIWTQGRWLWTRIVGSTLCGELVDSMIFYFVAFYGRMPKAASGRDHVHPVRAEERLGDRRDAAHLSRRGVPEEGRERGLLRHRDRISRRSR